MLPPKRLIAHEHARVIQGRKHLPIQRLQILRANWIQQITELVITGEGVHAKEPLGIAPPFGQLHRSLMGQKGSLLRKKRCKGAQGRIGDLVLGVGAARTGIGKPAETCSNCLTKRGRLSASYIMRASLPYPAAPA